MLILGIETAGPTASAALLRDGELLSEHVLHHTRTHSEAVMPMVERLLQELDIVPADIGLIAVNCGPGSFTGVRIGVCTANAMGAALHIPVAGIHSLRALYENVCFWPGTVCTMVDAGNQSAYFAQFRAGEETVPPSADVVADYISGVPANTLFVGDGVAAYSDIIGTSVPCAVIAPPAFHISRASGLCSAAERMIARGEELAMQTVPLYLRPSQAERMWSKLHENRDI